MKSHMLAFASSESTLHQSWSFCWKRDFTDRRRGQDRPSVMKNFSGTAGSLQTFLQTHSMRVGISPYSSIFQVTVCLQSWKFMGDKHQPKCRSLGLLSLMRIWWDMSKYFLFFYLLFSLLQSTTWNMRCFPSQYYSKVVNQSSTSWCRKKNLNKRGLFQGNGHCPLLPNVTEFRLLEPHWKSDSFHYNIIY